MTPLPPKPPGAQGARLAVALPAPFPCRHPVGAARGSTARGWRSSARPSSDPSCAISPISSISCSSSAPTISPSPAACPRRAVAPAGQFGLRDQWRDLETPEAHHRPGIRRREAARHLSGHACGRPGGGKPPCGPWPTAPRANRDPDEPRRRRRDLSHALFDSRSNTTWRAVSFTRSGPISARSRCQSRRVPSAAPLGPAFTGARRGALRATIRGSSPLTAQRMDEIAAGTAPDDLATKIMTTSDPLTGARFGTEEMVDQVAIFFLAGHETSASALAWALYLVGAPSGLAGQAGGRGRGRDGPELPRWPPGGAPLARAMCLRETLRLYPPVPMMVREAACAERFRDRDVPAGRRSCSAPGTCTGTNALWDAPMPSIPAGSRPRTDGTACATPTSPSPRGRGSVPARASR